ncbi:MAG: hypothetical protein IKE63_06565 [Bacilli bacterium]|nr:hypothetical protein [Bacilli bacterium]
MKQFIEFIKEVRKTPRGKAILFFAFYFIVFLVIIMIIRFNDNTSYEKDYEPGKAYSFDTSLLSKNNYHFEYIITKDNIKYQYIGDRNGNKETFTFNDKKYYYDGNKYYLENNEIDNPYLYSEFINLNNILLLIDNATYDSKTDYQSGTTKYNFLISSNTINSLINNKETDIDDLPNSLTISSDEDNKVDSIIYHLDSYCKSNKECDDNLEIDLSYEQFGEIKEIVNN